MQLELTKHCWALTLRYGNDNTKCYYKQHIGRQNTKTEQNFNPGLAIIGLSAAAALNLLHHHSRRPAEAVSRVGSLPAFSRIPRMPLQAPARPSRIQSQGKFPNLGMTYHHVNYTFGVTVFHGRRGRVSFRHSITVFIRISAQPRISAHLE